MKSLLLLLPLCVYAFYPFSTEENKNSERFGQLSDGNKDFLAKVLHGDPEKVRAHLARMSRRAKRPRTRVEEEQLKQRLKNIRKVKLGKPGDDGDLFQVNDRLGVSKYYFEGDIIMDDADLSALESIMDPTTRTKRQVSLGAKKWTDNTVYYYLHSSINQRKKNVIAAATAYLQTRTCIKFVENSTAPNRIVVINGLGCSSAIGMRTGEQYISLGDSCEVIGTVAHEFTHALGVYHTQSRFDRDDYVTVDLTYVNADFTSNFEKLPPHVNTNYTPYEYGSFMHYPAIAFTPSDQLYSILPNDNKYLHTIGHRQISFYDIEMINKYYQCDAMCPASTSAKCANGGTPNPNNCDVCNCPSGYGGDLCDQRPSGCGESLEATDKWQSVEITIGNRTDGNVRDVFTLCNYWITAPKGTKIQTKISEMDTWFCFHGCSLNGIEIKTDSNTKDTNPMYCCKEYLNELLTSELNPTPIIAHNRQYYSRFVVEYQYIGEPQTTTSTTVAPTTTWTSTATTTTTSAASTTTTTNTGTSCTCTCPNAKTTTQSIPTTETTTPSSTTTATTITPSSSTTTTRTPPPRNCTQVADEAYCIRYNVCSEESEFFKTHGAHSAKWACGQTCGFCGKPRYPCEDIAYSCRSMFDRSPMEKEYYCPKYYGYCEHPN